MLLGTVFEYSLVELSSVRSVRSSLYFNPTHSSFSRNYPWKNTAWLSAKIILPFRQCGVLNN